MAEPEDRSSEILSTVLQRKQFFRTAVLSLSTEDRELLVDRLADTLRKKAIDISGFVKLGGWPQIETWCAGDHLCILLAETQMLPRGSIESVGELFQVRMAQGGPWQQLVFSIPAVSGSNTSRWLSQRIKCDDGREQFLNRTGETVLDELHRGEYLTFCAISAKTL